MEISLKGCLKIFISVFLIAFCVPSNLYAQSKTGNRDQVIEGQLQAAIDQAREEGTEQSQENFHRMQQKINGGMEGISAKDDFLNQQKGIQTQGVQPEESTQEKFSQKEQEISEDIQAINNSSHSFLSGNASDVKVTYEEEATQSGFLQKEKNVNASVKPVDFNSNVLEIAPEMPNPQDPRSRLKKIELALQFAAHRYDANQNYAGDRVEKRGLLSGIYASYTYRRPYAVAVHSWSDLRKAADRVAQFPTFLRVEGDLTLGNISFDTNTTGKSKGYDAWKIDGRVLGGYDFLSQDNSFMVTPYAGIGYRWLTDKTGGYEPAFLGEYTSYRNIYSFFYLPVGVETLKHLNEDWDLDFKMQGSIVLWGRVEYTLSDIPGLYNGTDVATSLPIQVNLRDSTVNLKSGFGLRSSSRIIRKFERFNVFAESFIEFWHLNQSNSDGIRSHATNGNDYETVAQPLYEPWNYTLDIGTRLGVQF